MQRSSVSTPRPDKIVSFWHWPLRRQLLLGLGGTIILSIVLVGKVVRSMETHYLQQRLTQQSRHVLDLLASTSLEAVISEDRPVLTTIVQQSVLKDPEIVALRIDNEAGKPLVAWTRPRTQPAQPHQAFSQAIVYEGERFGHMHIAWDVSALTAEIERHVRKMTHLAAGGLLALGAAIMLWLYKLVTTPLQRLHRRLEALSQGEFEQQPTWSTARELVDLRNSIDLLAITLEVNKQREMELEQAEIQLRHERDLALAASQIKSEFLANMSHELRTPLHGILSFAGFGLKKATTVSPEKLHSYFQHIDQSGRSLLALLDDLLDLAKLEAGKMSFTFQDVEVSALLVRVQEECHAWAIERHLTFKATFPDPPIMISLDAEKIMQVLRNLVNNAIKFSPEGGTVTLHLQAGEEAVEIAVCDEGPGIPEGELETIFDKFVQSSLTKTGAGGTGLGLAICREIVTAHTGRIWAENRPEGGVHMAFTLPQMQPDIVEGNVSDHKALSV